MGVDSIMVTGEHISQLYQEYNESLLNVNRIYQRKLVWTLEEKKSLIDTILKGYPVPLFLFVAHRELQDNGKSIKKREIIDGLQRLEAIISFINNEFPVELDGVEQYFNLDSFPGPTLKVLSGELKQKKPTMDVDISNTFSQYYLAVTTIEADEVSVEDVFKRINATGRQLSPQELRQAGVVSKFNRVVQEIASRIRGDYTKQTIIPLEEMKKYSLSSRDLPYGLDVRNIFWTKQGIITYDGLRRSKDEEIIANLCNCILSNYSSSITRKSLDRIYDEGSTFYKSNEEKLTEAKQAWLTDLIVSIFDDFNAAFKACGKTFENLVTSNKKCSNKDLVFVTLLLAIAQLKQEGWVFSSSIDFSHALMGVADKEMPELVSHADGVWNIELRKRLMERVKHRIQKTMHLIKYDQEQIDKLYTILSRAAIEGQMYDFKLGVTCLADGTFNDKLVRKIVKTLTAMANTKPNERGYVIIGVADSYDASVSFSAQYGVSSLRCNDLYVTGVEAEATKYYNSLENYIRKINDAIESCNTCVRAEVIQEVLESITAVQYYDRVLIVLSFATTKPQFYEGKLYVRYHSNNKCIEMGSDEYYNVTEAFNAPHSANATSIFSS